MLNQACVAQRLSALDCKPGMEAFNQQGKAMSKFDFQLAYTISPTATR
jgi:hypothetical protein